MDKVVNSIGELLEKRKVLTDEIDVLYDEYYALKNRNAAIPEINSVVRKINSRSEEVSNIDRELRYYKKQLDVVSDHEVEEHITVENNNDRKEAPEAEEHVIVERNNNGKKGLVRGGILALTAVFVAGIGATHVYQRFFKNKNCAGNVVSDDKSVTRSANDLTLSSSANINGLEYSYDKNVDTPAPTNETPSAILTDPSNEYDIENTMDLIYAEDINPMIKGLNDPTFEAQVKREDMTDMLRMISGELPLNVKYNDSTFNQLMYKFIYVYGAQGGHGHELYPVHYEYLCEKDSALAQYCKEYDEIYNRIAKLRREGNVAGFIEEVGALGKKLAREWGLFGMYGGWNPYLFKDEELTKAYYAAVGRFTNYVEEMLLSNDLTICFDVCVDVENNKMKQVEIRDVFEAMMHGTSLNGEYSIMIGNQVFNPAEHIKQALKNVLQQKSEELGQKKVLG